MVIMPNEYPCVSKQSLTFYAWKFLENALAKHAYRCALGKHAYRERACKARLPVRACKARLPVRGDARLQSTPTGIARGTGLRATVWGDILSVRFPNRGVKKRARACGDGILSLSS